MAIIRDAAERSAKCIQQLEIENVQRRIVERDAIGVRVGREFDLRHRRESYRAGARRGGFGSGPFDQNSSE